MLDFYSQVHASYNMLQPNPVPKLLLHITIGLKFVVVDAFTPAASSDFRLESMHHKYNL